MWRGIGMRKARKKTNTKKEERTVHQQMFEDEGGMVDPKFDGYCFIDELERRAHGIPGWTRKERVQFFRQLAVLIMDRYAAKPRAKKANGGAR
jgi:hypothetical protein